MSSKSSAGSTQGDIALSMVHQRNGIVAEERNFLRRLLFTSMVIHGVSAAIIAMGVYFYMSVEREYFATDPGGRVTQIHPVSEPLVSHRAIWNFSVEALQAAYGIDFVRFREQIGQLDRWYTQDGASMIKSELVKTGFLADVERDRLVAAATPTATPNIIQEGKHKGIYKWRVEVPLLLTLTNQSERRTQNLKLVVTIRRVSETEKPGGLAVERVVNAQ